MVTVHAGTDTYGRVKSVCGMPIVTKFFMFHFLPCYPLQSYFFMGSGRTKWVGIPLIAGVFSTELVGIPLACVDKTSVAMAYGRGVCAAVLLGGVVITFVGVVSYFTGQRFDDFARTAMLVSLMAVAVGAVGGGLTYLWPLTSQREHAIRSCCAELLGIAADPARVAPEISVLLAEHEDGLAETPRTRLLRRLVQTRANIAQGIDTHSMELKTDELLAQLGPVQRASGG